MTLLAAGILGIALAALPLSAQQTEPGKPGQSPPAAPQRQVDRDMIGMPVFSSDGHKIGEVTEVGELAGGHKAIRAEIGQFLGIGSTPVVIASDMFEKKADRIELAITAAEVKESISRQRSQQQKQKQQKPEDHPK
jgi:hypothetical protein